MTKKGELIVLSGPSGTGKSTVVNELMKSRDNLFFSVSFTTRSPREGEVHGIHYNFVDKMEFERMIAAEELLEWAQYVGNYYGTSLKVINEKLAAGIDVILDIEVQGAAVVREKCPEAVLVFIVPPSFEELSRRLHGRGTDSEEVICGRLERAREELKEMRHYDYVVINDQVPKAAAELSAILTAAGCRTMRRMELLEGV